MLSTFVLIPPLPMSTEGKIKINKKVDLQNFQFLLGSESCFVDTRQLVVIQLPVQISELNISTEGLKVRGKRGIDQTWTRHAAVAAGRVVHSVAHNELIFDSDKREREKWEDELVSWIPRLCLSLCLYWSFQTSHEIHFSFPPTPPLKPPHPCYLTYSILLPSPSFTHNHSAAFSQTPTVQWYFYLVSTRDPSIAVSHSDFDFDRKKKKKKQQHKNKC